MELIFHIKIVDRQRNEEKKRLALEENLRLEAEKERKRKGLSTPKVRRIFFSFQYKSYNPKLISIRSEFHRVTNKSKRCVRTSRLESHHSLTSVRRVVQLNRCLNRPKTMSQAVKQLLLIVIAYQIRVHKPFWWMIWRIDTVNRQRVAISVVDRVDRGVEIEVDLAEMRFRTSRNQQLAFKRNPNNRMNLPLIRL